MTNFKIDITSDTVCPWCYVGSRKLDAAIDLYKKRHPGSKDTFSITWHPYLLNPDAPKQGIDKRTYYVQRFGADRTVLMNQRLAAVGARSGINFKFGGRVGASLNSHRLLHLAGEEVSGAAQNALAAQLFRAYFEDEQDITSDDVLAAAAARAGIPEPTARAWLASDRATKDVLDLARAAKANQVTGVPNFVIQDQYEIGGAQEPDVFVRVFERIREKEETN